LPKKPEPLLLLKLKPSRRLKQLIVVIHALALGSSLANALPIAVKLALLTGIGVHFHFTVKRFKTEQRTIRHNEALGWGISDGDDFKPVQILASTVITVFAIFLHFTDNAQKQSMLIINDALNEDDYRRLIVRLKTAGTK